jgi:hypothetical protein
LPSLFALLLQTYPIFLPEKVDFNFGYWLFISIMHLAQKEAAHFLEGKEGSIKFNNPM